MYAHTILSTVEEERCRTCGDTASPHYYVHPFIPSTRHVKVVNETVEVTTRGVVEPRKRTLLFIQADFAKDGTQQLTPERCETCGGSQVLHGLKRLDGTEIIEHPFIPRKRAEYTLIKYVVTPEMTYDGYVVEYVNRQESDRFVLCDRYQNEIRFDLPQEKIQRGVEGQSDGNYASSWSSAKPIQEVIEEEDEDTGDDDEKEGRE